MAKEATHKQLGKSIDIVLTSDVSVGDVVPIGTTMIGVANTSGLTGETISVTVEEVYTIAAAAADVIAAGDLLYFDATNRVLTTVATSMVRAGRALSAKSAATAGSVDIKLNAA